MAIRALVIDDSITVLYALQQLLERNGIEMVSCRNALDGLSVLGRADQDIDLIILDLVLPGIVGGQHFIHIVQQREALAIIPIIVISALPESEVGSSCINAGARAIVSKPWSDEVLLGKIRMATARHEERRRMRQLAARCTE